jgi:hypothetical protein
VAVHDLQHPCPVRWTTGCRSERLSNLAEIERAEHGRRDHAERLHIPVPVVIETVNGSTRNAEHLAIKELLSRVWETPLTRWRATQPDRDE